MKPFTYSRADERDAAVAAVAASPDAKYIGGGTNLVDLMKLGVVTPGHLVDVRGLEQRIDETPDGGVAIGAGVRNSDIAADALIRERYPALARAVLAGASGQLRNMATAGGNLLQRTRCPYFMQVGLPCNKREPGSGCGALEGRHRYHAILGVSDACIATHPSDMAVALTMLGASVNVLGPGGARRIAIDDLYRLPGDDPARDTTLEHGDLITSIELPPPTPGAWSSYRKVRDRSSFAFALVSVAASLAVDGETVTDARIALGGVGTKPWRAATAERAIVGGAPTAAAFGAGIDAELAQAVALPENAFKVALARGTVVAVLEDLAARR